MGKRKIRKKQIVPFVRLSCGREITIDGVIRYPKKEKKLPFTFDFQLKLDL